MIIEQIRRIPHMSHQRGSETIGILHRARQSAKVLLNLRRLPKPSSLEEQIYAEVVREGDVCFDIGANVGWIALFLARTAGAAGKVIAFEPVWPTYTTMCANIQNTINVRAPIFTMPFGLAEEEKTAIIHVPDGRFEFGSLAQPDELAQLFPEMKIARYECQLLGLGYRFLFLCRGGLIEHLPSQSAPSPPEFEDSYNVLAYVPGRHAERIRSLDRLRFGTGQALRVARGLYPNRAVPR